MSGLVDVVKQLLIRPIAVRRNVHVGRRVHIGPGSVLWAPRGLSIGDDVYIGKRCTIECDGSIGSGTLIANHVGIVGRRDHDVWKVGAMASRAPWIGEPNANHPGRGLRVEIGPDVWIGYGAIILSGVTIGRGAVVAAGSVVTESVAPYCVVAGNPARVVGQRFDNESQEIHERMLDAQSTR